MATTVLFSVAKKMGNLMSALKWLVKQTVVYSYNGTKMFSEEI